MKEYRIVVSSGVGGWEVVMWQGRIERGIKKYFGVMKMIYIWFWYGYGLHECMHLSKFIQNVLPVHFLYVGFPVAQLVKNLLSVWETWVWSLDWKDPWRRERLPSPVFWPRELHGLYSPRGGKELDKTEQNSLHFISSLYVNYISILKI